MATAKLHKTQLNPEQLSQAQLSQAQLSQAQLSQTQLNRENLVNLISLWQCYGAKQLHTIKQYRLKQNHDWPHRVWFDNPQDAAHSPSEPISNHQLHSLLSQLRPGSIFPTWPASIIKERDANAQATQQTINQYLSKHSEHWTLNFQQTAMYLPLHHEIKLPEPNIALSISRISTSEDIAHWVEIGSKAFGYQINFQVIQQLSLNFDIHLLLARLDQKPVACGLLYQTGKIIGIHQVGMAPEFQGQGLAKAFMMDMIKSCLELGGDYAVLQASTAGKPLYQKLGFSEQFVIDNYQKL